MGSNPTEVVDCFLLGVKFHLIRLVMIGVFHVIPFSVEFSYDSKSYRFDCGGITITWQFLSFLSFSPSRRLLLVPVIIFLLYKTRYYIPLFADPSLCASMWIFFCWTTLANRTTLIHFCRRTFLLSANKHSVRLTCLCLKVQISRNTIW